MANETDELKEKIKELECKLEELEQEVEGAFYSGHKSCLRKQLPLKGYIDYKENLNIKKGRR